MMSQSLMASFSVRQQLSETSPRLSLKQEAGGKGFQVPVSIYQLLSGFRPGAAIWRGFQHRWEYNHRLNRFGSYVRSSEQGDAVVGHTAASGSGPDTAHVKDFYSLVQSPHIISKVGSTIFPIRAPQETLKRFDETVEVPLGGGPVGHKQFAVVLNGFDLVARSGANKMMQFQLTV